MPFVEGSKKRLVAGEALARRRRVKISGATVVYSDAGEDYDGVTEYAAANAAEVAVRLKSSPGTFEVTAAGAIAAGENIYGAADGKVSAVPNGAVLGKAIEAATADADIIEAVLDADLSIPFFPGMTYESVAANKTLDAQDVGKAFVVTADAKVITLPATVAGLGPIAIINGGGAGEIAVNISPNANDKIMGPDIAGTDNKDLINTKATAVQGDYVIITGDGADGWFVGAMRGTWATEA